MEARLGHILQHQERTYQSTKESGHDFLEVLLAVFLVAFLEALRIAPSHGFNRGSHAAKTSPSQASILSVAGLGSTTPPSPRTAAAAFGKRRK